MMELGSQEREMPRCFCRYRTHDVMREMIDDDSIRSMI